MTSKREIYQHKLKLFPKKQRLRAACLMESITKKQHHGYQFEKWHPFLVFRLSALSALCWCFSEPCLFPDCTQLPALCRFDNWFSFFNVYGLLLCMPSVWCCVLFRWCGLHQQNPFLQIELLLNECPSLIAAFLFHDITATRTISWNEFHRTMIPQ